MLVVICTNLLNIFFSTVACSLEKDVASFQRARTLWLPGLLSFMKYPFTDQSGMRWSITSLPQEDSNKYRIKWLRHIYIYIFLYLCTLYILCVCRQFCVPCQLELWVVLVMCRRMWLTVDLVIWRRRSPAIAVVRRELYDEGFGFCVSLWSLSGRRLLAVAGALIGPWPWRTSEVSLVWP